MTRLLRIAVLLVLVVSAVQIAMCAIDCNCFLAQPRGLTSHSLSTGDADGCLCCAQNGQIAGFVNLPSPAIADFAFSSSLAQVPFERSLRLDHPPRS